MKYGEAFRNANRDSIIDDSEIDEILEYLGNQIKNPFTVDVNYFKPLKKKVKDKEILVDHCLDILTKIEEVYPSLTTNLTEDNTNAIKYSYNIYKFFVKNISSMVYIFLKEYVSNNKNRKNLVAPYLDIKLESYPKEQYGKKENYILITKINSIIKDIRDSNITLSEFINYINRANDSATYIDIVAELIDQEIVIDEGVVEDIMRTFIKSDEYNPTINKLSIWLNKHVIAPCLSEMGYGVESFEFLEEDDEVLSDNEDDSYE